MSYLIYPINHQSQNSRLPYLDLCLVALNKNRFSYDTVLSGKQQYSVLCAGVAFHNNL